MYSEILTLILLFTILNMVVRRAIFSSCECQFKSFKRLMTVPGSSSLAVFYKSGSSPLYSFNIVAMLLSMWVPHAAGLFQTRTNEGDVGLTFNILWTGMKITSDETKGPVSLPYNVLYMKAPIQIGGQLDSQERTMRYGVPRSSIRCMLMNDWVSRLINPQDLTFVTTEGLLP